jgi:tRNA threonylcarbamoyladenosine biosynthesis protein TsaB
MLVLALDASTYMGSVALISGGSIVAESSAVMRGEHEERLMPAIGALLQQNAVAVNEIQAMACGAGPGSFTSLRIAASIAKGLAVSRGIPLLVAPSTLLTADIDLAPGRYVAALDAMRGDWFCQSLTIDGDQRLQPGRAWRASRRDLEAEATGLGATVIGPGEASPRQPRAGTFGTLLRQSLASPVDLASWEPDYGRKAEAQVRWEAEHGRELGDGR